MGKNKEILQCSVLWQTVSSRTNKWLLCSKDSARHCRCNNKIYGFLRTQNINRRQWKSNRKLLKIKFETRCYSLVKERRTKSWASPEFQGTFLSSSYIHRYLYDYTRASIWPRDAHSETQTYALCMIWLGNRSRANQIPPPVIWARCSS